MLAALFLGVALLAPVPTGEGDTVLVQEPSLAADRDEQSVLGWRRVPAEEVEPGDEVVDDVYLDLLEAADEPFFRDQWGMRAIGSPAVWPRAGGGEDVLIAVVDSGIDLDHPDLAGRVFTNPTEVPANGVDDDRNGLVDDVHGWDVVDGDADPRDAEVAHGTQVTSVAVASLNGLGMAGVAPNASFLPVRACTTRCDLIDVGQAIVYATDMGADVINLSLGGFAEAGPVGDAVTYAGNAGVLVVAAAGNGGSDIDGAGFVPAGLPDPNLIAVAATDRSDGLWSVSNWGRESVDVGAPGVEIVAATLEPMGGHTVVSGTSFAAPHVAGTAALMMAVDGQITPEQIMALIGRHGDNSLALATRVASGARLEADAAVSAAFWDDIDHSIFDRSIVWLDLAGITSGCNPPANDLFCPTGEVTRGQTAAFLSRVLDLPAGPDVFADDTASIFQADINALAAAGITAGCNPPANDHFCPSRALSRGEMAALLSRALDLAAGPDAFSDDLTSIFQADINALAAAGITAGCNPPANDRFCPDRPVTRGEMAAFLHRALG